MDSGQLDLFRVSERRNGWANVAARAFDRSFKRYRWAEDAVLRIAERLALSRRAVKVHHHRVAARNLLLVIQRRVELDELPAMSAPRIYGAPGVGGGCDACDQELLATQLVMSVPWPSRKTFAHLHADCYTIWNAQVHLRAVLRRSG